MTQRKPKLVNDARQWHRWWSIRLIAVSAFFSTAVVAYGTLPHDWLPYLPVDAKRWLSVGALVSAGLAGVARVIQQAPKE
jgi:hypothetical protein